MDISPLELLPLLYRILAIKGSGNTLFFMVFRHSFGKKVIWFYRLWLFNFQPIHQPFKLFPGKAFYFILIAWPLVITGSGQPFIKKDNAIFFPVYGFNPILFLPQKRKIQLSLVSIFNCSSIMAQRPSVCLRISVLPQTIYTLSRTDISLNITSPAVSGEHALTSVP